ncbi:MAG TPA: PAS domain S-box protein [Chthonomonadaceae bacterium]|nr:PAS domain S-box protein [Chthonomonadaceae bacterium]
MGETPNARETKQQARKHVRSTTAIGESEEWLFTALQSIGDAVIATDQDGHIVFMNVIAVSLTGWSAEDAQGRDCHDVFRIVNERTRLETESPVTKVIRDGVISGLANHTILIGRDGSEHNIDDSGSPIRDVRGTLIGVVLIFRDVSERRRAELTLQEHHEILQTLFDHIPVIIAFLDDRHQIKWVNREWSRVLGWSLEEMNGGRRLTAQDPLLGGETDDAPAGAGSTGAPSWREFSVTVKDGRLLDLSWTTVRLSDGTSIGIGQDVTRRKRAEDLIGQQMEQIEERNARLVQAMRETDHRVKNNLQSVAALLDIQVMSHESSVPVQELAQIRMHIATMAAIHDLLVSDVNSTGSTRGLSAKAALRELLPMLQMIVGENRIVWTVDDITLPVKHGMSMAVLINELVNNAVKHGGHQVELRLVAAQDEITLEVCDDGPGFAEPFHPHRAASFGLELVESIGRLDLGGKTTYENRPDGGACVRVTFPLPVIQSAPTLSA